FPCGSKTTNVTSRKRCSAIAVDTPSSRLSGFVASPISAFTVLRNVSASSTNCASTCLPTFSRNTKYVTEASTSRISAIAPEYHSVRRLRTELNIVAAPPLARWYFRSQYVTSSAPCVQQRLRASRVDLAPHAVHVHFNEIGKRIELLIPHVLCDFRASDHAPG